MASTLRFPRYRMRYFYDKVDKYFIVKGSQGTIGAAEFIRRLVPIQLRTQVFDMIAAEERRRIRK